ncbi:glycosyltransferase family 2 protein [Candidatus Bathyarchaeota archaeon]|nr:MAG: glycosyltransferase family 2 protein [Candidatus Bathyarchaeota archaeon]
MGSLGHEESPGSIKNETADPSSQSKYMDRNRHPLTVLSQSQANTSQHNGAPEVSIIMPTKDRAVLVKRATDSVLNQSFEDWELIILDDSSVQNKKKIAELRTDSRIRFLSRPSNSSVALARTIGVDNALGKFSTFLDSDDYYSPKRLEKHLQVWSGTKGRLGLSWDVCIESNGDSKLMNQPFRPGIVARPRVARQLFLGNFIHASAGFTRTEYARGIDFSWNILSDWLLFMRLGEKFDGYFINEPLTFRDLGAEDRVANQFALRFFYTQSLSLRRRLLRSNPKVYFLPWVARDLSRVINKVKGRVRA